LFEAEPINHRALNSHYCRVRGTSCDAFVFTANSLPLTAIPLPFSTASGMPGSDCRSNSGCWTCRARRKKCDEQEPSCIKCISLHLECYRYGSRPHWMDGGQKEKAKVLEFKATVKRRVKVKRRVSSGGEHGAAAPVFQPVSVSLFVANWTQSEREVDFDQSSRVSSCRLSSHRQTPYPLLLRAPFFHHFSTCSSL
jgi:hypothetical protein